jgi:hypothetical protein
MTNPICPLDKMRLLTAQVNQAIDSGNFDEMHCAALQIRHLAWDLLATTLTSDTCLRCPKCRGANLCEYGTVEFVAPVFLEDSCLIGPIEITEFPDTPHYFCQDCRLGNLTPIDLVLAQPA